MGELRLNAKQRNRLRNLNRKVAAGEQLTDQQMTRYNRLTDLKKQNQAFNKTNNPKEFRGEAAVADYGAGKQINYGNADFFGPLGQQTTEIDPVTGRPVVKQNLSGNQADILSGGENLTKLGQDLAGQNLRGYSKFSFNDKNERARIEDEVFSRLNRDTEQNRSREMQAKEQELFNKGITYSNDPNSRYQREIGDLNRRYDDISADNRSQAVKMGGEELQRNYGIQLGQHQQGMTDTSTLQSQGTGLMLPQFQGFQGANYNLSNPTDVKLGFDNLQLQRDQLNSQTALAQQGLALQEKALNKQNQPPPPPSPFEQ